MCASAIPNSELNHVRRGSGSPLLLVHGLGAGWRSWEPIIDGLAASREVIAVDLPGCGETPSRDGEVSIATLADSVAGFIHDQGLDGVATAGQSMGGRIVLELARRGVGGDTVALDPGGFWSDREVAIFGATLTKGPKPRGAAAGRVPGRGTIGWGERDLVTLPRQARRATTAFPDATLHWFARCGHFPQWDTPDEAIGLILNRTG